jgi:hypothetical protein
MTGATPQGRGEQTQPMASPPWLTDMAVGDRPEVAGGWPSGRADRGPYADMDTVDEPEAWVVGRTGLAPSGQRPSGSALAGADASQGAPGGCAGGDSGAGSGGVAAAQEAGADWPDAARSDTARPDAARPPGSGGPLLAWLWGEQGQAGEYLLASHSVTVGRDPGNDIVLADSTVSREHAKIEYCEGQWSLQPTDSAGPTWANGQPVEPGQRLAVTDGDRLRFGFHTQFRLLVPSAR